ncbi:MAG TPA: alpha/beta fold hydrolase [Candidatus Saccharimonadales bacterium]|nr:alpha/beta fold hydrolase [Candidatus Saccharimonadales bacterium]
MSKKTYNGESIFLKGSNEVGILLLHGWSSYTDELLPLAKYLNSFGFAVSAPFLRGHGTKPEDLFGVTWEDWLQDAKIELQKLEKYSSKIFIGGISMGGDLAMLLSGEKSVAGLISLGSAVRYKFQPLVKITLFFMGLTKTHRKKYYPPWARKKMGDRKVYPSYPVESAKEVVRLADATRAILPQVTKPILIMQSTTDFLVSKKSPQIVFEEVKSKIKKIYWVKDGYHVFVEDRRVWKEIENFVKSNL